MQYAGSQYNGGAGYSTQQGYGYSGQYYQQQQPQPIQQQYSGQQQQYSATPYVGTVPFPQPSPYAAPTTLQPVASQQSTHRPPRTQTPHPSTSSRRRTGSATRKPLRSAMKDPERSRSSSTNGNHLSVTGSQRTRRQSGGPELRPRMDSMISRTRTNSSSRVDPGTLTSTSLVAEMPFHDGANFLVPCQSFFFSFLVHFIKTTFSCR
jgi:hypothetical protein